MSAFYKLPSTDGYRPGLVTVGNTSAELHARLVAAGFVQITEAEYRSVQENGRPAPVRRPALFSAASRQASARQAAPRPASSRRLPAPGADSPTTL